MVITEERVRETLRAVMDPEIPTCSIVDLGVVERISVGDTIEVDLLPTFAGCPALDVIREDVVRALEDMVPAARVEVRFVMSPPWTVARMSEAGRESLKEYGISPPLLQISPKQPIACPYCGALETIEESAFGPTPCRTIRYCSACKNPFEGFKAKL